MNAPRSALIVGMGGLGCPAALGLARSGVRRLTLIDPDRVELTNLHRQLLHRAEDLGRPKVESAAERLRALFSSLVVETHLRRLDAANADALFHAHEVVIDGTDAPATKLLMSDAAVRTGIPLIYGGVLRWAGQAMRIERGGPCLRCLFEESAAQGAPSCAQAGVMGSVAGMVGALQAQLACAGRPGELHVIDGLKLSGRTVRIRPAPDCPTCAPLDVTREVCPMTYVRTKLRLEAMSPGSVLEVLLRGPEARKNIPRSAREEGHEVLLVAEDGELTRVLIRKAALSTLPSKEP